MLECRGISGFFIVILLLLAILCRLGSHPESALVIKARIWEGGGVTPPNQGLGGSLVAKS